MWVKNNCQLVLSLMSTFGSNDLFLVCGKQQVDFNLRRGLEFLKKYIQNKCDNCSASASLKEAQI